MQSAVMSGLVSLAAFAFEYVNCPLSNLCACVNRVGVRLGVQIYSDVRGATQTKFEFRKKTAMKSA